MSFFRFYRGGARDVKAALALAFSGDPGAGNNQR